MSSTRTIIDPNVSHDYIIFDTETTTLYDDKLPAVDPKQGFPIQIGYIITDLKFNVAVEKSLIVRPPADIEMSPFAYAVHKKSMEYLATNGGDFAEAMAEFEADCKPCIARVGYNVSFDDNIMTAAYARLHGLKYDYLGDKTVEEPERIAREAAREEVRQKLFGATLSHCVMKQATPIMRVPGEFGGFRRLKLSQVYRRVTGRPMQNAHDAMGDVRATFTIFKELMAITPQKG